tara:strand:- start:1413 stop:2240 length:828 start_codon:yes stop_codon:yes gene_type:complete
MAIDQDKLDIGLDQKQNSMLDIKQGFYAPSEGEDGDTGLCENNGVHYFGIKSRDKWHFTALKKDLGLSDGEIIDQSINNTMKTQFESYLNNFSTTIRNIINFKSPRQYHIPWYTRAWRTEDGLYNKHMSNTITVGFRTQADYLDTWLDEIEDIHTQPGTMFCFPVPFKCRVRRMRGYANSTASAANTKIAITVTAYSPSDTSGTSAGTGLTAATSMSSINGGDVYWEFPNGLNVIIQKDGWINPHISVDPNTVTVASGDPYITHTSGLITLEEVL